ncbi:MAG: TRAP-type C4-dicarboxylate transport system permease small subunit [Paracoccaceae bacterium]|jgi:TRAP-type C4-dicarboxylate transport system permease small subunit
MRQLYDRVEFSVGVGLLATITFLVFIAAVMRFFGNPLIWSVDLAKLLFIWLCFIGATRALRQKAHLGVDLLIRMLGLRARLWVKIVLAGVFIAFLLTLAVEGYKLTMLNWERIFGDSRLSYAWGTIAVPVGSILLSLSILGNLMDDWRSKDRLIFTRTKADKNKGDIAPAGMN